jgi:hypothetical protein
LDDLGPVNKSWGIKTWDFSIQCVVDLRKAVAKLGAIAELSAKDQDLVVLLVNKFIYMLGE